MSKFILINKIRILFNISKFVETNYNNQALAKQINLMMLRFWSKTHQCFNALDNESIELLVFLINILLRKCFTKDALAIDEINWIDNFLIKVCFAI